MSDLNWQLFAFSPDPSMDEFIELSHIHGERKARDLMRQADRERLRFNVVESSVPEGWTLDAWRRRSA